MRLLTLIATAIILASYNGLGQKIGTKIKPQRIENSKAIEGRCAIIVRPDSKKIALLKKQNSSNDYIAVVNDNQYYLGTSINFLDSVKVRQIEKVSTGILSFKSLSGQYFRVSLDSFDWGIILFNGRTKPIKADVTDIDADYRAYMKK